MRTYIVVAVVSVDNFLIRVHHILGCLLLGVVFLEYVFVEGTVCGGPSPMQNVGN